MIDYSYDSFFLRLIKLQNYRPSSINFVNACLIANRPNHFDTQSENHSPPLEEAMTDNAFARTFQRSLILFLRVVDIRTFVLISYKFFVVQRDAECRPDEYTVYSSGWLLVTFFFPGRSVAEVKRQSANSFRDEHSLHVQNRSK